VILLGVQESLAGEVADSEPTSEHVTQQIVAISMKNVPPNMKARDRERVIFRNVLRILFCKAKLKVNIILILCLQTETTYEGRLDAILDLVDDSARRIRLRHLIEDL